MNLRFDPTHQPRGATSPFRPIKLLGVLSAHKIKLIDCASAVRQANSNKLSSAAISLLANWNTWPKSTPTGDIKRQVEEFLRTKGVQPPTISQIWDFDDEQNFEEEYRETHAGLLKHRTKQTIKPHPPTIEPLEVEMLSPAAKKHFCMSRDPFVDDISGPNDVYIAADQRYISEAMFMTARHGGFVAVVGESGSGKSTLRKMLSERIRDQPIRMIYPQSLDKSRLSTSNICQAIINDLAPGTKSRASLEGQARQVHEILQASSRADNNHVLVIEEAHDLNIQTIKYLKRFYELEDGFKKLLSIILIGQPELKDKLDERRYPEAREVIRRIEIAELAPLNSNLEEYLALKFKRIGIELGQVTDKDCFDAIRARLTRNKPGGEVHSQLYPLVVNNLVTKALNAAAALGVPVITADLIRGI